MNGSNGHPGPVVRALADALRRSPGRPLVTYDNRATGERIELSVATFDNWVSKIANLLTDELMLDPGATMAVDLPSHWQSTVAIIGAWTAGLQLVDPVERADVRLVGPDALSVEPSLGGQILACSLRPLGARFTDPLPAGWLDFAAEVPAQPDLLLNPSQTRGDDIATTFGREAWTHDDLAAHAQAQAASVGLAPGARLATDANPSTPDGLSIALVAPMLKDASVVLVSSADEATRADIVRQEAVTCTHWVESSIAGPS